MQLRIFTEPQQGASYDQLLAVATTAETAGFDGFFRSDHYLKMGAVSGLPGPTHAWVTLAGLARETSTIRLGTLVSPATFYRPGPLAIMVAQVDAMSGGRVELGFGTGWYGEEHDRYGLDFPALGARFDLMEEYLEQMTGLWATPDGDTFTHEGRFHRFDRSPALPKPAQRPGPPIIIGGRGPSRTPALVARFASEYNVAFASLDDTAASIARVRQACTDAGRSPDDLTYSVALVLCLGDDQATMTRRAAAIGREPDELRANGAAGTVDEVRAKLAAYADLGCTRTYLQVLDLTDLDHVREAGAELI
ncbi:MAG: LLM class F420-dependent oxidoreductase [Acidimicrobiales bacterium]